MSIEMKTRTVRSREGEKSPVSDPGLELRLGTGERERKTCQRFAYT